MVYDKDILFYAFRYALGRKSYAVSDVVTAIINDWDDMLPGVHVLYHREIREAIENNKAGMDMDVQQWESILKLKV